MKDFNGTTAHSDGIDSWLKAVSYVALTGFEYKHSFCRINKVNGDRCIRIDILNDHICLTPDVAVQCLNDRFTF